MKLIEFKVIDIVLDYDSVSDSLRSFDRWDRREEWQYKRKDEDYNKKMIVLSNASYRQFLRLNRVEDRYPFLQEHFLQVKGTVELMAKLQDLLPSTIEAWRVA